MAKRRPNVARTLDGLYYTENCLVSSRPFQLKWQKWRTIRGNESGRKIWSFCFTSIKWMDPKANLSRYSLLLYTRKQCQECVCVFGVHPHHIYILIMCCLKKTEMQFPTLKPYYHYYYTNSYQTTDNAFSLNPLKNSNWKWTSLVFSSEKKIKNQKCVCPEQHYHHHSFSNSKWLLCTMMMMMMMKTQMCLVPIGLKCPIYYINGSLDSGCIQKIYKKNCVSFFNFTLTIKDKRMFEKSHSMTSVISNVRLGLIWFGLFLWICVKL